MCRISRLLPNPNSQLANQKPSGAYRPDILRYQVADLISTIHGHLAKFKYGKRLVVPRLSTLPWHSRLIWVV